MRHNNAFRKLSRSSAHRRSLFRNMATSFLAKERFNTTIQKAKELRPIVEKLVTLGRNDTVHARRQAYGYLMDKKVVHKLFADIGPRFKTRPGGYVRIVRAGHRHGDAAEMAIIEFVVMGDPAAAKADKPKAGKKADSKTAEKKAKPAKAAATKSEKKSDEAAEGDKPAKKRATKKEAK